MDALVEGTVARSGSHLRITANLLQAFPEKHLWAESYDSEVGDALTVQGQIARAVAREIQVNLTPQEQNLMTKAPQFNAEAQDLFLRGRYVMSDFQTAGSAEKAIRYFQQALERQPDCPQFYQALAVAYAIWIPGMTDSPHERSRTAKEYALKALTLDNTGRGPLYLGND